MGKIFSFLDALSRNAKMLSILSVALVFGFACYQHGKYVGQLGGHYDSAAYEGIIATASAEPDQHRVYANDQYIDANPQKYTGK